MFKGRAHKFGDNIDTDVIIPARYLNTTDPVELAKHCMEDVDTDFVKKISQGDIIVAGKNFGCGSSREHAPISIKAAGISCIVAHSFAGIFYRNAINIGLAIFESPECVENTEDGDLIEIYPKSGAIKNITKQKEFKSESSPEFIQEIINAGGLVEWVKSQCSAS
jgi:3-isopropylmalate/(R)-2-methylmalate dehydratase small subunit